jgi:hypothetical protein
MPIAPRRSPDVAAIETATPRAIDIPKSTATAEGLRRQPRPCQGGDGRDR